MWLDPIDLFAATICSKILSRQIPVVRILEVGVFKGSWILSLARNSRYPVEMVGIDPYPDENARWRDFLPEKVRAWGYEDVFSHFESWEELKESRTEGSGRTSFDIIHIDGDHSFSGAEVDLSNVDDWLAEEGVVVIDDFYNLNFPGVALATYQFLEREGYAIFLATLNKVYVCRIPFHAFWVDEMERGLEKSALSVSERSWRGLNENLSDRVSRRGMLLCLDDNKRYTLLPSVKQRALRRYGRDWLPPRLGAWLFQRSQRS